MSLLPRRGYLLLLTGIVVGTLIASGITVYYYRSTPTQGLAGMPEEVEITFLYSSEKQGWLEEVTPLFEDWIHENFNIRVSVKLVPAGTHETVNMILRGYRPTIWSPASNIWIPYLNELWAKEHDGKIIAKEWTPLVLSPTVIAGWKSLVEKYNVTSFLDLYRLAKNNVDFKWGHPDPRLSNGGTTIVVLMFAEAAGKPVDQLTIEDVKNPEVLEIVKTIESKAVAYGKSTGFFGKWAADSGPQAITFFGVYENVVLENSLRAEKKWGEKLVAIYPKFGTLLNDHPFVILDAPWVTSWQKFVASQYLYFLLTPEIQYRAMKHGFRPANPSVPLDPEIFSSENGVSLDIPTRIFKPPAGEVLEAIFSLWEEVKNPGV